MKQTSLEFLKQRLIKDQQVLPIYTEYINGILYDIDNELLEMEKQQQGYSEEEVELIANEMVNWAIDNIGNPFPQSGKKFDEVIAKFKNNQDDHII
jgi:hypothetical protein